ncbi:hypothetical protein IID24_03245 [Patescibacteria group bacterium]|nr:hypothetical protein [Patescibacteria group bacterium]
MNYTDLFMIKWDDSYNDPDYGVPATFNEWLYRHPERREELAQMLERIAENLRDDKAPFNAELWEKSPTQKAERREYFRKQYYEKKGWKYIARGKENE